MQTTTVELQPSSAYKWLTFDREGNTNASVEELNLAASTVDKNYAMWNKLSFSDNPQRGIKKGIGLGAFIAAYETVVALALQVLERTPATFTNLFTTLSECLQVLIANYDNTKVNPEEIQDVNEKKKVLKKLFRDKEKREDWINATLGVAGGIGLYKWGKEMLESFKGEEVEVRNLPLYQKVLLSAGSFVSAVGMGAGYTEKCSFVPIAKEENGGLRAKEMRANGNSDFRCSVEWLFMTFFPFLVEMKPVKALIDFILPAFALMDSVGHFVEKFKLVKNNNDHASCEHGHNHEHGSECNHGVTGLFNIVFRWFRKNMLKVDDNGHRELVIPKVLFNEWFFGNKEGSGLRARILVPIYKLFGSNPPECYMKDGKLMFKIATPNEGKQEAPTCVAQSSKDKKMELPKLDTSLNSSPKQQKERTSVS